MHKRLVAIAAGVAVAGAGAAGVAMASDAPSAAGPAPASAPAASRLDDGRDLLPQARISEADAIAAAQGAASGKLDEVDLEHAGGTLVFNVDVGTRDVKVDAATGEVLSANADD